MQEATADELRELFSQFGPVKAGSGAVTLKKYGGTGRGPFAYLDFADASAAQAAVEASTVEFKGVDVSTITCSKDLVILCPKTCTCQWRAGRQSTCVATSMSIGTGNAEHTAQTLLTCAKLLWTVRSHRCLTHYAVSLCWGK